MNGIFQPIRDWNADMQDSRDAGRDGDTQRTQGRDSLFLVAPFRVVGEDASHDVRVRNLSEGGLMVELDQPLDVGTAVTLRIRGIGRVDGKVAWWAEGRAGVALDRPIDPKKARKPVTGVRNAGS